MMGSRAAELVRFGLVGTVNTALSYGVFALLLSVHIHYALATFIGGAAGTLVGFRLTGRLVFNEREEGHFARYGMVVLSMYFLNIGIQKIARPYFNPYLAGAVATGVCFLVSFSLNRAFVFRRRGSLSPELYGQAYADTQIRRSRSRVRAAVRSIYLGDILRHVRGPAVDFGCGSGDLLARLPPGSIGLEINAYAVEHCQARGLEAFLYDPESDQYALAQVEAGRFKTLLLTHVIEHLEDPATALKRLLGACARLGIDRVVITVPCERGFRFDPTHRTFVDLAYLEAEGLLTTGGFSVSHAAYFPVDWRWIGKFYTFHELRVLYDKCGARSAEPGR